MQQVTPIPRCGLRMDTALTQIQRVPQQRRVQPGQMDADLVGTAAVNAHLQQVRLGASL